jgi:tRNA A58 N-methylase Trm61
MATIVVHDRTVTVRLDRAHRLRALRSKIDIPLTHVVTAEVDPALGRSLTRRALPASMQPASGKRVFRDVQDPDRAVAIELAGDRYGLVVVDVEEPWRTVEEIDAALRAARQS